MQPWSDAYDLGPNGEHIQHHKSFCHQLWHNKPVVPDQKKMWLFDGGPYEYPHSGYCWAACRHSIEWLGGLIDTACSGAGDHHMALALVGRADRSFPFGVTAGYMKPIVLWQDRATHHINQNIGFVWGTVEHFWHGRKADRKYVDRWDMIVKHKFDPSTDLKRNSFGVYELAGNKPELSHAFDTYFRLRNEDSNTIS